MSKTTKANYNRGAWSLEDVENPVWQVPDDVDSVQFDYNLSSYGVVTSIKGVVIDENGTIYGKRTLTDIKQDGYALFGRVSVGGKKHRAFTSSRIFEKNGKLVSVAVLHI